MSRWPRQFLLATAVFLSQETLRADTPVDYITHIKPLLATKCYSCHGAGKQEAGLRLETRELILRGGDSGAVVAINDARASLLLERVRADADSRMPPADEGAALTSAEVALLQRWIDQGAVAPDEEIPAAPAKHWAFQPIHKPELPPAAEGSPKNPIDILLAARHADRELKPQPRASQTILIRRLYLDLIGLPPTLKQLQDPRSWEEIVDELLASPHHGERWGRHWMDVWRYSDWYGLGAQLRYSQKHMWHWRDWIIDSLNNDKGYDRMIQEMLAGDEIAPTDPKAIAGTGFLARNYYLFNRTTWLDSTIEHTGKAFLGLTLNCAKCHDHKYDPITQQDYYRFRAIFEPHQVRLDPVPGTTDFEQDGLPRVFDDQPDARTFLHRRGNPADPDTDTAISPGVPAIFASFEPETSPVELPPEAFAPGLRNNVQRDHRTAADQAIHVATQDVEKAEQQLAGRKRLTTTDVADPSAADFSLKDDFSEPRPSVWDVQGSNWVFQNGTLQLTVPTRNREYVRLRRLPPLNFDLTCVYTTTGGTTYKSVTFRFDESVDGKHANFVYTSAHRPGPKVQVAWTRNGQDSYPPDGRAARPIKIGQQYRLRYAVRDRLMNVWLNDEFVLAYRLPDQRRPGHLALSGFDATVAFDSISIRSLSQDTLLVQPTTPSQANPETALKLAQAKLRAAKLRRNALEATIAADKVTLTQPESGGLKEARHAARLQAEAMLGDAEYELLAAGSDQKKSKQATTKQRAARKKLAAAKAGNGTYKRLRASRKALETPAHKEADYPAVYSSISTGRRRALASWLTSEQNPLTARVAVNHVWTRHFGEPLVESVFDFGLRAKHPQYLNLLDYLAAEFMESGWNFKRLHRLIVTSNAWQRRSSVSEADPATVAADPDNHFFWRMNTRRMESQLVRDSLLLLSGTLDPKLGGPSLDANKTNTRRSLYFKHSRDDQNKFLTMFDDADLMQCYRRSESIVPQQALALANSELSMNMAEAIAARTSENHPGASLEEYVTVTFLTLLGRHPTSEETQVCLEFQQQLSKVLPQDLSAEQRVTRTRTRLIHSLLNHNDFISIR